MKQEYFPGFDAHLNELPRRTSPRSRLPGNWIDLAG